MTFDAARASRAGAAAVGSVQVRGRESKVEIFALGGDRFRQVAG